MGKLITIDDSNFQQHVGDGEKIFVNGHWRLLSSRHDPDRPIASKLTMAAAGIPILQKASWPDLIRQQQASKSSLKDLTYDLEATDQRSEGQCWIFGTCEAARTCIVKQGGVVRLPSPQSLAYAIYGGRGWGNGGGDPGVSVDALQTKGASRTELWGETNDFQSSKYATPAAEADRANNKLVRVIELGATGDLWTEFMSCLLQNIPCGCTWNWQSHYTAGLYANLSASGEVLTGCRNSWGTAYSDRGFYELAGTKKVPDWCAAFVEMTFSS